MLLCRILSERQEEQIPILLKMFHVVEMEGTLPNSYEAKVSLILKPHKDSNKKENYDQSHSLT